MAALHISEAPEPVENADALGETAELYLDQLGLTLGAAERAVRSLSEFEESGDD